MKTAEEFINEKGIKDTLYLNGEWVKGGLSSLLEAYANQSKWISVEDEQPKSSYYYLCRLWVSGGEWIEVCEYDVNGIGAWYYVGSNKFMEEEINEYITHWQPLPEPPNK